MAFDVIGLYHGGMQPLTQTELEALKLLMSDKGLNQRGLAAFLGVGSNATISHWLSGGGIRPAQKASLLPHLAPYMAERTISNGFITSKKTVALAPTLLGRSSPWPQTGASNDLPEFTILERREVAEVGAGPLRESHGFDCACRVLELPKRFNLGLVKVHGESMLPLPDGVELVAEACEGAELEADGSSSIEGLRAIVPDGSLVAFSHNDSGVGLKRIRYVRGNYVPLLVELHADNGAWAEENGFPLRIKKSDHLVIYGKVIGRVRG
jgi:transcriptional regulator with XRE-family HTH domain